MGKEKENQIEATETAKKAVETQLQTCNTEKTTLTNQNTELQRNLNDCNTAKTTAIEQKTLCETRFARVEELERSHIDFSVQAKQENPGVEASVGSLEKSVKCDPSSTSVVQKVGFFALGAMALGLSFKLMEKKPEEKLPLLEI